MAQNDILTWQSIHAEILRRISTRVWAPGAQLPKDVELAAEFGCSRSTINRAMRELADAGLLDRRRKAGTRVALHPIRKATLEIPIVRRDVEARGGIYRHQLLGREVTIAPLLITSKLGLETGAEMLHLPALHFSDGAPYMVEDRWVNPAAIPAILEVEFTTTSANEWLVQNAPLTTGDISFSATNATAQQAGMLQATEGDALFAIERSTWVDDVAVTNVRMTYAHGFKMHTQL
ncbi:MAG: GntR family transcriptional regulator [Rhodobacterales bacterium]|nr:GntR family transcriptional regulator [Rhodobacterales bacterium]